jgi:hypothetical protein
MKIQTHVGNYGNPFTCKYLIDMHHLDAWESEATHFLEGGKRYFPEPWMVNICSREMWNAWF